MKFQIPNLKLQTNHNEKNKKTKQNTSGLLNLIGFVTLFGAIGIWSLGFD